MVKRAGVGRVSFACVRMWLKSYPNLGSMKARVAGSSGLPGERNTSCTIGGTSLTGKEFTAARCNIPWRFFMHSSHSCVDVQRCNKPCATGEIVGLVIDCVCTAVCALIVYHQFHRTPIVRSGFPLERGYCLPIIELHWHASLALPCRIANLESSHFR